MKPCFKNTAKQIIITIMVITKLTMIEQTTIIWYLASIKQF
jgi:hypothetical protein